jgi:hypothetical protein
MSAARCPQDIGTSRRSSSLEKGTPPYRGHGRGFAAARGDLQPPAMLHQVAFRVQSRLVLRPLSLAGFDVTQVTRQIALFEPYDRMNTRHRPNPEICHASPDVETSRASFSALFHRSVGLLLHRGRIGLCVTLQRCQARIGRLEPQCCGPRPKRPWTWHRTPGTDPTLRSSHSVAVSRLMHRGFECDTFLTAFSASVP